jgi:hypothetical protein
MTFIFAVGCLILGLLLFRQKLITARLSNAKLKQQVQYEKPTESREVEAPRSMPKNPVLPMYYPTPVKRRKDIHIEEIIRKDKQVS